MISKDVAQKLATIVGAENYDDSNVGRLSYSYDSTPNRQAMPDAVVSPRNTKEVSEIVKICNAHSIPIYARGTGTNLCGDCTPTQGGIVMLFKHMNKIIDFDLENLTITVQPGVITMDIIKTVEAKGLFYPPDPGTVKVSTIVGNIAENAGGLRGLKYGVTRDYVIGLEIVLANGDIIRTGGKLAKDVAGYDFTRLMVGSEGTLGIITEAILKVVPKPETKKTALALYQDVESAAKTVSKIIAAKIIPTTLEFLDKATLEVVEDYVKIGLPTDVEAVLLIEQDGPAEVVARDMEKIAEICKNQNATSVQVAKDDVEADKLATARRTALSALARLKPTTILEDATVPRSEVANLVKAINEIAKKYNLKICTFGHAGDGNLHPTCPTDARNHEEMERVEKAFAEIFEAAVKLGGTISGEHGIGTEKAPFLELKVGKAGLAAMKAVKDALDPNNILNPGKIFLEQSRNRVVISK
ncbi:glycolate oxidase subunit GlcD [Bacillus sp. 1NLA3E]|uniref:glycolate oxidase subunit GlcD n=1 Tax=Bacillus sp. 1NLA3E TaxID=666686 RepID=UPI000247F1EA|nr:glycolate oxidase subunit GlcD [Bacillus sp. 1NLA3E]AGK52803.1 glycolate oxidase subunit GlcD [Bacillus sp. 1NLA3E]